MCEIRIFGKEFITKEVLEHIKKMPSKASFLGWLHRNYDALKVYHGCRPQDVSSYYAHGFRPSDFEAARVDFDKFLKSVNYSFPYNISHVIDSYSKTSRDLIYFILDREDFIDTSPHYIIYGSELMLSLAQNVDERLKFLLREIGIPTIFHCVLPLHLIKDKDLSPIYDYACEAKGNLEQQLNQIFSNYSVIVSSKVDGKYITGHDHPTEEVYDLHAKEIYRNELFTCSFCELNQLRK